MTLALRHHEAAALRRELIATRNELLALERSLDELAPFADVRTGAVVAKVKAVRVEHDALIALFGGPAGLDDCMVNLALVREGA